MGHRGGLRNALGTPPTPDTLASTSEAHERGAILVAAVFDAFFTVYLTRTRNLMRIARAGGMPADAGEIHPDLADRLASEAAKCASHFFRICVRAIDYCPVSDITFGDYLRAIVTADQDAFPEDPYGYRESIVAAFTARGIRPDDVTSTSEEALRWPQVNAAKARYALDTRQLAICQVNIESMRVSGSRNSPELEQVYKERAILLHTFAKKHRKLLGLVNELPISVGVIARSVRVHQDGIPRPEYVFLLHQKGEIEHRGLKLTVSGGTTVVVANDGTIRFAIAKPATHKERVARQSAFMHELVDADPRSQYADAKQMRELAQGKALLDLASLHRGY
jgi:hypothetical protein